MKSLGNTALVDLTAGTVEVAPTPDHLVRAFLGGRGLSMFYLYSLLRADVDALSPANPLIFGCGLLTGLPAPSSGRMNISAKSPESGILGDANMGGFFPAQMRKSGLDRVIVLGRAEKPVLLYLTEGRVEIRDAGKYWGMDVPETQSAIEADYGRKARSAVIGRAGENLVRFACVMNGRKNAAGRGGMGAVMAVSYTHLRAHETVLDLVCRLLLEKKKKNK